jgi:hypothetical protein
MTDDDDPEIEHSLLSGPVTRDGMTVSVEIYRIHGDDNEWSLEVIDAAGASTVWEDTFTTDREAYEVFQLTLESEGLPGLMDERSDSLH